MRTKKRQEQCDLPIAILRNAGAERASKKFCWEKDGASREVVECRQQDADDSGLEARAPVSLTF